MIPETPAELVEFMLSWLSETGAVEIIEARIVELKKQKPESFQMTKHAEEIDFFLQVKTELNKHQIYVR
jgi:hypothetical protein